MACYRKIRRKGICITALLQPDCKREKTDECSAADRYISFPGLWLLPVAMLPLHEWRFPPSPPISLPHTLPHSLAEPFHTASNRPCCEGTAGYSVPTTKPGGATNAQTSVCACNLSGCMQPKWIMAAPTGYSVTMSCLHPEISAELFGVLLAAKVRYPQLSPKAEPGPLSSPLPHLPPRRHAILSPTATGRQCIQTACFFSRRAPPLLCSSLCSALWTLAVGTRSWPGRAKAGWKDRYCCVGVWAAGGKSSITPSGSVGSRGKSSTTPSPKLDGNGGEEASREWMQWDGSRGEGAGASRGVCRCIFM